MSPPAGMRMMMGMGKAAPVTPSLVSRWDNFMINNTGNLIGRTAQGTNGGWVWQADNAALGNVFTLTPDAGGQVMRNSGPGDGYQLVYTDMGPGNINMLIAWRMRNTAHMDNDCGIVIKGIDETNILAMNSFNSGCQIKEVDNTSERDFATEFQNFGNEQTQWFRYTDTGGTQLFEWWKNPANSSTPPTVQWDLTGWLASKFLGATKVGIAQFWIAKQRNIGGTCRFYGSNDPALLPIGEIGPI